MTEITNTSIYLSRMQKPIREKLKVVKHFPKGSQNILDVGCADGTVTIQIAKILPNKNIKGIDLDTNFINIAKNNSESLQNIAFERVYLRDLLSRETRYDCITFLSVLHEFYTYGEGTSSVLKAISDAHELLQKKGRIIIRDMILYDYLKYSDYQLASIREKIYNSQYLKEFNEFEKTFGQVSNNYLLNHFLLKYWYKENWDRELKENYTPVTIEQYIELFKLLEMKLLFKESTTLKFLKNKWKNDFRLTAQEIAPLRSTMILVAEKK